MAENGTSTQLSTKQERLIAALLQYGQITDACQQTGIPPRTYYNWLKQPTFSQQLREAQKRLYDEQMEELRIGVVDVIRTLRKHATSEETPVAVQVRACDIYLSQSSNQNQIKELQAKAAQIDKFMEEYKNAH